MPSEFIILDKAIEEAERLRQFLEDIHRWSKPVTAICIYCYSQSAIRRTQSNMYNDKSRLINFFLFAVQKNTLKVSFALTQVEEGLLVLMLAPISVSSLFFA